ncbi:LrgB-like family-domain-containing protein [Sporodiniella umbellata]|nr:LrgB-like family-domain-containing protein [Sporodiniella umbellata]
MSKCSGIRSEINKTTENCRKTVRAIAVYVQQLPSIRQHLIRWTFRSLYFVLGFLYNWAVSVVLRKIPNLEQFPSSVAATIVLFTLLMCARAVAPQRTDRWLQKIDPYTTFGSKSMSIMFVPPLVQIANNPPTPGPEIGRMVCVFLVGYGVGFLVDDENSSSSTSTLDSLPLNMYTSHQDSSDNSAFKTDGDWIPAKALDCGCCRPHLAVHGPLHDLLLWCMKEANFDDLACLVLFSLAVFVYLPLPSTSPAAPPFRLLLDFSLTVLLFSLAGRVPDKIRILFHPIVVTSAGVMAAIGYFERVKGFDIHHGIDLYKTGITFISLVEKTRVGWPGAGDLLAATMDVAIISLAFNMDKSRPGEWRLWIIVILSILPVTFLVMFITPLFAQAIGCTPDNSIVWSCRSVTAAIGIVIGRSLGANLSIVTCLIVFTGVMGPIFGGLLFKLARVREDDYLTIGITMGSHSHGVGTSFLIARHPKASGMSSIAFTVFGTLAVVIAFIPSLAEIIRRFSGF